MKRKSAFTLIELVIVLAILALLVAIAVPKYNASQKKAALTAHQANVSALETAALLCWSEHQEAVTWTKSSPGNPSWEGYLQHFPDFPKQLKGHDAYTVHITKDGKVEVVPGLELELE